MTVDDASKFAGAADPALTGSVEGLVAGDSLGVSYVRANVGSCHAYGGHAGSGGYSRGNDARERSRGYRGRRHPAGRRAWRAHAVG